MGDDGSPTTYQPTVQLQIEWKPGETEPTVRVWVDETWWALPTIAKMLRQVVEWHQAEESYSDAASRGLPSCDLEEENAEQQRQTLYSLVHELIYSDRPDEEQGFGSC